MRTLVRSISYSSLILACGLLGACATTGNNPSLRTADDNLSADTAYMAKVNRVATRRGVQIYWVNPPRVADREVASR
jgi:hypothetical protein